MWLEVCVDVAVTHSVVYFMWLVYFPMGVFYLIKLLNMQIHESLVKMKMKPVSVFVPRPPLDAVKLDPQGDGISRWGLWEVSRSRRGALTTGLVSL